MMSRTAEPLWMKSLRAEAQKRFAAMAWPTTSEEEWRRTDVSRLGLDSFAAVEPAKPACPREGDPGTTAGFIRFDATRCTEAAIAPEWGAQGVRLVPMDLALEEFETQLHEMFKNALDSADNRFLAWHYATWSHGALLWVPAGVEVREPFLIDMDEHGQGSMSAPHIAVILGQGAHASVVQRTTSSGDAAGDGLLSNAVVDLRLGDAAGLIYHEVQELGSRSLSFRHTRAEVGRDASLRHCAAEFGSRLVKTRTECNLVGPGAEAFLDGIYYCTKGQHMDLRTVQNHRSPKATSRAYYKGAVAGGGRTVFQGLIEVAEGASGTDAYLTNRNLILGEAARSDSIPTLRIGNNDVKCSHGSTTGKLNAEELFYLESRGYSAADAREMLVVGYFEDLLTTAPESYREDALTSIRDRLRGAA